MSIIQQLQEKYGKLMAIIIGISLVVFVIMLAFENGGSLFRDSSTTIGSVNGDEIELNSFQKTLDIQTSMLENQNVTGVNASAQANSNAWNMEVSKLLVKQEAHKLGLSVTDKELTSWIFGNNPPQDFRQAFSNPQTGAYDPAAAAESIKQIKSKGTAEQKAQINNFLDQMVLQKLAEKYEMLFANSNNVPKWMIEKQNAEASLISSVSFVKAPYSTISDSAVKVTDKDIQAYIDAHKDQFESKENRSISYVQFSAQPTATDSAAALDNILKLKPAFDSTNNMKEFLTSEGASEMFYDGYITGNRIQIAAKDAIFKAGVGNTYGPYVDGSNYTLAKVLGSKVMPDTVKVRHILIGYEHIDPQTGQRTPIRDDSTAKKLSDSLFTAVKSGSNFDSLVVKFSTDMGSVSTGGVFENVVSGQMVPEFNDYIFGNSTGSKGIVKTQFGYHIIEILSQKGSSPAYKIAYLNKPIIASQQTDAAASNAASAFAAKVKDVKSFDAESEKLQKEKGIYKAMATNIEPMSFTIQGLGNSRPFVKSVYTAKLGDILQPERIGEAYVVGVVTAADNEGTMSVNSARMYVEPILINKKKGEAIIQKLGKITTLEAAATALQQQVQVADSIHFAGDNNPLIGFEPKVVGAAFNNSFVGKIVPDAIPGAQGVFVVQVKNISNTPANVVDINAERKNRFKMLKQKNQYSSIQVLLNAAKIKDNRSNFY